MDDLLYDMQEHPDLTVVHLGLPNRARRVAYRAPNPSTAWHDFMYQDTEPEQRSCAAPTLITPDGRSLLGALPAWRIQAWLEATP